MARTWEQFSRFGAREDPLPARPWHLRSVLQWRVHLVHRPSRAIQQPRLEPELLLDRSGTVTTRARSPQRARSFVYINYCFTYSKVAFTSSSISSNLPSIVEPRTTITTGLPIVGSNAIAKFPPAKFV